MIFLTAARVLAQNWRDSQRASRVETGPLLADWTGNGKIDLDQ
jgi:hypothetical protein